MLLGYLSEIPLGDLVAVLTGLLLGNERAYDLELSTGRLLLWQSLNLHFPK